MLGRLLGRRLGSCVCPRRSYSLRERLNDVWAALRRGELHGGPWALRHAKQHFRVDGMDARRWALIYKDQEPFNLLLLDFFHLCMTAAAVLIVESEIRGPRSLIGSRASTEIRKRLSLLAWNEYLGPLGALITLTIYFRYRYLCPRRIYQAIMEPDLFTFTRRTLFWRNQKRQFRLASVKNVQPLGGKPTSRLEFLVPLLGRRTLDGLHVLYRKFFTANFELSLSNFRTPLLESHFLGLVRSADLGPRALSFPENPARARPNK